MARQTLSCRVAESWRTFRSLRGYQFTILTHCRIEENIIVLLHSPLGVWLPLYEICPGSILSLVVSAK